MEMKDGRIAIKFEHLRSVSNDPGDFMRKRNFTAIFLRRSKTLVDLLAGEERQSNQPEMVDEPMVALSEGDVTRLMLDVQFNRTYRGVLRRLDDWASDPLENCNPNNEAICDASSRCTQETAEPMASVSSIEGYGDETMPFTIRGTDASGEPIEETIGSVAVKTTDGFSDAMARFRAAAVVFDVHKQEVAEKEREYVAAREVLKEAVARATDKRNALIAVGEEIASFIVLDPPKPAVPACEHCHQPIPVSAIPLPENTAK